MLQVRSCTEMNSNKYKIIISGKNIYREYDLVGEEKSFIKIGTTRNCEVRFKKDNFFEEFELRLIRSGEAWQMVCSENTYLTTDGVMKIYSKNLSHGDEVTVKYQNYNREIFKINFFIDFDRVQRNYNRIVNIEGIKELTIGGVAESHIYINDVLLGRDTISLRKYKDKYYISDNNTKYGVYVNGEKILDSRVIKDRDFFSIVGYSFYYKKDKLYMSDSNRILIRNLSYSNHPEARSLYDYPKFNRSTRVRYIIPTDEIEILQPNALPQEPNNNIILSILPAVAMIFLTVFLRGNMMGGNNSFIIFSVASISVGIFMSIINVIRERRKYNRDLRERREKYLEYIREKESEIGKFRRKELNILQKEYRCIEEVCQTALDFTKELFDRDKKDNDFLSVRLGTGTIEARRKIKYRKQEFKDTKDDLVDMPEKLAEKYRLIERAPVVLSLLKANAVGIVGTYIQLCNMLENITIDICVRHFYKDVKLVYLLKEEDIENFAWLRWLRHVYNDDIGMRNLIYDEESKNAIFEYLYIELSKRESTNTSSKDNNYDCYFVVFVFDEKGIKTHPISKYIDNGSQYGFTFIFFEASEDLLPKGCTEIIRLDMNEEAGEILPREDGEKLVRFTFSSVSNKLAEEIALKLAPVYVDEVNLESQLTKNITLFQLLNILSVDDLDIANRWAQSEVYKTMAAPLGVKTKNQIVYLDLHEKFHGPHGLVAGTTGSGKSEILQTYILSMASLFHPYEVGFVIIDFKGGGMVNQFKDLPHLVGAITNIDGREIDRSLLSIKAELRKRQEIFAQYNVNHIDLYIKKYKAGEARYPLPHLILIVDEFAELKSEYPDFMKELISAVRIGRSLGVHLILATQKPSGVVDNQIWSNSKFKLCLKVQTKEDSKEVIKTPLAAEIKEPGRAYLQVGNNEIFELFQSAYSGAPAISEELGNKQSFEIDAISLWGKRKNVFKQTANKGEEGTTTQLEAIVNHINNYCKSNSIEKLPGICLPPLPELITYGQVKQVEKNIIETVVPIGLYDNPSAQIQDQVLLNLSESHTLIIGASQFGKTSLLQTIIRSIAENYDSQEVNLYILDFASMVLKNFSQLKHVGGIIVASEDEKLKNFIKMIHSEISYRKDLLARLGLSSFNSYREAGYRDIPHIIIMIDNFIAFRELYSVYDEDMINICREGVAVGISLIVANLQTSSLGYKYLSNFANRIGLYCNDSGEYTNLFDRSRVRPKNVQGRGIVSIDKRILEFQSYLGFEGEKEIDRVKDMRKFIEDINGRYNTRKARSIPEVPNLLTEEYIKENYSSTELKKYEVAIGIDYDNVKLVTIDLQKILMLSIMGREGSGKTNFLKILMNSIEKNISQCPAKAYILDSIDRHLNSFKEYSFVEDYTIAMDSISNTLENFENQLKNRQQLLMEKGFEELEKEPLLLMIIQNRDVITTLSEDYNTLERFKRITKQYKALKVCFIFSDVEDAFVGYSSPEVVKLLKDHKRSIVCEDLTNHKFFEINSNAARIYKKSIELGDAYYFTNSSIMKIKTVFEK